MGLFLMAKIQIFKNGNHFGRKGDSFTFTPGDIKAMAEAYNPEFHEAPLVIGHPKDNSPAFGWVKALEAKEQDGDTILFADIDVSPDFQEAIDNKHYKKVSAAFYAPNDQHNPNKGQYSLRHVGALGAQPPAIKGLQAFEFSDSGDFVEFSEEEPKKEQPKMPKPTITPEELEAREKALLEKEKQLEEKAAQELEAKQKALQEQEKALEAKQAEFAEKQARSEAKELVDTVIKDGKLTPAQAEGLVEFMAGLNRTSETLEFSEGGEDVKTSPKEFLASFLEKLPKQVEFSEMSEETTEELEFSEEQLANKASLYQAQQAAAGNNISMSEAVRYVSNGGK